MFLTCGQENLVFNEDLDRYGIASLQKENSAPNTHFIKLIII